MSPAPMFVRVSVFFLFVSASALTQVRHSTSRKGDTLSADQEDDVPAAPVSLSAQLDEAEKCIPDLYSLHHAFKDVRPDFFGIEPDDDLSNLPEDSQIENTNAPPKKKRRFRRKKIRKWFKKQATNFKESVSQWREARKEKQAMKDLAREIKKEKMEFADPVAACYLTLRKFPQSKDGKVHDLLDICDSLMERLCGPPPDSWVDEGPSLREMFEKKRAALKLLKRSENQTPSDPDSSFLSMGTKSEDSGSFRTYVPRRRRLKAGRRKSTDVTEAQKNTTVSADVPTRRLKAGRRKPSVAEGQKNTTVSAEGRDWANDINAYSADDFDQLVEDALAASDDLDASDDDEGEGGPRDINSYSKEELDKLIDATLAAIDDADDGIDWGDDDEDEDEEGDDPFEDLAEGLLTNGALRVRLQQDIVYDPEEMNRVTEEVIAQLEEEEELQELIEEVFYANCTDSALEHVFLPLLQELREISAKHKRMLALSSVRLVLTAGSLAACALVPPVLGVGFIATIGIAAGIKGGVFIANKVADWKLRQKKAIELSTAEKAVQYGSSAAVTTISLSGALTGLPTEVLDTALASVKTGVELSKASKHTSKLHRAARLQKIARCKGLKADEAATSLIEEADGGEDLGEEGGEPQWRPGELRLKGFHSLKKVTVEPQETPGEPSVEKKARTWALTSALIGWVKKKQGGQKQSTK
uniref:Transmembrane protein n=1 Tax=Chromera velia CCMP2878 TaxID=1169474 RepID=A0A0G4I1A4_9ALVE|eukprot:Cvel_34653.t1-p1 / transcript=Cvel_34653.t1 / gene=Cvel_34653 / organism=Chromera_velia_CCMP2878 / gene_product=hypothetical protein / transcript_product=hypothetical protein / location=Cvel_scaffold6026:1049-3430(+) / protein_length=698 / sequence_SO=supercontig / SO=protein_coding / is_pseudo=false